MRTMEGPMQSLHRLGRVLFRYPRRISLAARFLPLGSNIWRTWNSRLDLLRRCHTTAR